MTDLLPQPPETIPNRPFRNRLVRVAIAVVVTCILLVVIAVLIIGFMAHVAIRQVANTADMQDLRFILERYQKDHGRFPLRLDDRELDAYGGPPRVDRWGNPYYFLSDGSYFVLASFGRDGKPDSTAFLAMRAQVGKPNHRPGATGAQCRNPNIDQILTDLGFFQTCGK